MSNAVYPSHFSPSYLWYDPCTRVTHSYVQYDSFICATWRIHMCDTTPSYVQHGFMTCLLHTGGTSLLYVWYDSFIRETWLYFCHSYERHESFQVTCVTWIRRTCDMTYLTLLIHQQDAFICMTWIVHLSDGTRFLFNWIDHQCHVFHSSTWHDELISVTLLSFQFSSPAKRWNNAKNATQYVKLDKTRREGFKRNYYIMSPRVIIKAVIIIIYFAVYNMLHSSVRHERFTRVIWYIFCFTEPFIIMACITHLLHDICCTSLDPSKNERNRTVTGPNTQVSQLFYIRNTSTIVRISHAVFFTLYKL